MKKTQATPDLFRRGDLEQTERCLLSVDERLATLVRSLLEAPPATKPPLHVGGKYTDHFRIDLDEVDSMSIVQHLLDAEAKHVDETGEASGLAASYGSLADRWGAYVAWKRGPVPPTIE